MDDLVMKIWITSHIYMQSCGYVFFVNKKKMKFFLIRRLLYTKRKQDFNEGLISTYSSCESGEKFSNILCNACTDINKKVVHFIDK